MKRTTKIAPNPQILDLTSLFSGKEQKIVFDRSFPLGFSFPEAREDGECSVSGTLSDYSGTLQFQAEFTVPYETACARCLKPIRRSLHFTVDETVEEGGRDVETDAVAARDEKIDLAELALRGVVEQMPLRHLCREGCKGLCDRCGKDLNEGDCGCEKTPPDPRLAGLSRFFDE